MRERSFSAASRATSARAAVSAIQQCYTDNNNAYPATVAFAGTVGTPAPTACASDLINLSSGTTMTYALATGGASYILTAYNSGGHHSDAASAYSYNSAVGGSIG